ncbi:MAG TPA: ABC transporter permease [Bellilinea sp.]|nr:ABC transporter permease [Bellilinea sp.]
MREPTLTKRRGGGWIALLLVAIFLLVWELIVRAKNIPPYLVPAPSMIFSALWTERGLYLQAFLTTLGEAFAGLLLGVALGSLIASLLILVPAVEDGVMTLALFTKSTPMVAIAPLLTIYFGFGIAPKIIITALITFFPVLINVLTGLQKVDPAQVDTFYYWNATKWEVFRYLRVPSALPLLFVALKISGPLALTGAVIAEWTGASGGLGRQMWLAYTNLNLPYLFGAIFMLAIAGITIYKVLDWAEKQIIFWQRPSNSTT